MNTSAGHAGPSAVSIVAPCASARSTKASTHESLCYLPESPVALAGRVAAGPETPSADVVARILARVRAMIESVSCVTPQIGAAGVIDATAELVAGASRQAVLVGPFLAAARVEPLLAEAGEPRSGSFGASPQSRMRADREQAAALAEHAAVIVDGGGGVSVHAKVAVEDWRRSS